MLSTSLAIPFSFLPIFKRAFLLRIVVFALGLEGFLWGGNRDTVIISAAGNFILFIWIIRRIVKESNGLFIVVPMFSSFLCGVAPIVSSLFLILRRSPLSLMVFVLSTAVFFRMLLLESIFADSMTVSLSGWIVVALLLSTGYCLMPFLNPLVFVAVSTLPLISLIEEGMGIVTFEQGTYRQFIPLIVQLMIVLSAIFFSSRIPFLQDFKSACHDLETGNLPEPINALKDSEEFPMVHAFNLSISALRKSQMEMDRYHHLFSHLDVIRHDLVRNLSHEIRTPLAGVLTYLNLASSKEGNPTDASDYINKARDSAQRLEQTVSKMLQIEDIEKEGFAVHFAFVKMKAIAMKVCAELSESAKMKEINMINEFPLIEWNTDPILFERILKEVLDNAIKFSKKGKRVWLSGEVIRDTLMIKIRDEGEGIPYDKQSVIFEGFLQVDGSMEREASGLGTGLYLVKNIVHRLGGKIDISSEPKKGSTVIIELPKQKEIQNG